jgi:hypothetical protein
LDAQTAATSVRQLLGLLLTSSTFRLLLADAFTTARSIVADAAASVGQIAAQVQGVAEGVEEVARPGGPQASPEQLQKRSYAAVAAAQTIGADTRERWERLARESPDRVRESIVGRIQNVCCEERLSSNV